MTMRARSQDAKRPSWSTEPTAPTRVRPELATIGTVTVADLQAWHDRTIGGKLIVSISGDFDSAAMEAKLRATFEGLPQAKPSPARHDVFHGPTPGVYFINKEDVNQSNVEIVGLGTDRRNPDVPSAGGDERRILGGGFAQPAVPEESAQNWGLPTRWAEGWRSATTIRQRFGWWC